MSTTLAVRSLGPSSVRYLPSTYGHIVQSAILPLCCFNVVIFILLPLHRKTWLAKASPSGCGWTTLLTW